MTRIVKFNPFKPGSIVAPGMFAGRLEEILSLEKALFQTKHGNALHFLIKGERGIGKSSLLYFLQTIASGDLESVSCGKFNFLVVSIELEPSNSYLDLIGKVGSEYKRVLKEETHVKAFLSDAWEFLKKWEVMGVKYSSGTAEVQPYEALDDLVSHVSGSLKSIKDKVDGLLILIDETDKPKSGANLGEFCKLFTERLSKRGCNNVCLGLAGLPSVLQKLKQSHESSVRLFNILELDPLKDDEVEEVINKALANAKDINKHDTLIDPAAKTLLVKLSEGYPHFIQQFGYCAFDQDNDGNIDVHDALNGALAVGGAFHQLGQKYFDELYFDQIGSDEYRDVLKVMAERGNSWISKKELQEKLRIKPYTLNNALAALKRKGIVVPRAGKAGDYRLPLMSFAVWIKGFAQAKEIQQRQMEFKKEEI